MSADRQRETKAPFCSLGHRVVAYECPACAEAHGDETTVEHWRWFRSRTSSKRIRAEIDQRLEAMERR